MKKKIIIAITKANFGGAQKYVYTLAKALKNQGFLVKVMVGGNGILTEKLKQEGIEVLSINALQRDMSLLKEVQVFWEIFKILQKERPTVFHLNSSKIGAMGAFIGRIAGIKKIIFTVHGFAFNEDRNFLVKFILKIIYWKTFLLSHKTIFVSQKTMDQAPRFLLPKSKFKIIYNGIEDIHFYDKDVAKKKLGLENTEKIIGTIAELHPIKNLESIVNVARNIDAKFVIIGDGEERERLQNLINEKQLENKIRLTGYINEASRYIKAFDVFVLPSKSEAMPLVILEAMQANIPIVASPVGGIPEMVPKDCLFDEDRLQEKILEKIGTTPNYDTKKFSLEKMVEKTAELY